MKPFTFRTLAGLIAVLLLCTAAYVWDSRLKAGPLQAPSLGAQRTEFFFPDAAAFWESAGNSLPGRILGNQLHREFHGLEVYLRQAIGIRPTAARFRLWLGRSLFISHTRNGYLIVTRPGIALRVADLLHRPFGTRLSEEITPFDGYAYAWRGGSLFVSDNPALLARALIAPPATLPHDPRTQDLHVAHHKGPETPVSRAVLTAAQDWPLELQLPPPEPGTTPHLLLHGVWPEDPVLALAAADPARLLPLARALPYEWPAALLGDSLGPLAREVAARWQLKDWPNPLADGPAEAAVAWFGFGTSGELWPRAALAVRSEAGVQTAPLPGTFVTWPHVWNGRSGTLTPIAGEALTLCTARRGGAWYATTQEPLMYAMMHHEPERGPVEALASFRLDWNRLGDSLRVAAHAATGLGLLAGGDPRRLDAEFGGLFAALRLLGIAEIRLQADGSGAGVLFAGARTEQPQ